jgi:hypothetical protein
VKPVAIADGSPTSPKTLSQRNATRVPTVWPMSVLRMLATSAIGVSKNRNAVAPSEGNTSASSSAQARTPDSPIVSRLPSAV